MKIFAGGRGRPPKLLVSLESVYRLLTKERANAPASRALDDAFGERLSLLEAEVAVLRARYGASSSRRERALEHEVARLREELEKERKAKRELEDQNARFRADAAKAREVARLGVERSRLLSDADRLGQDQLLQFLTQDFVND